MERIYVNTSGLFKIIKGEKMTKGRKAILGKTYHYKGWEVKFDGTNWMWGSNIAVTLAQAKRAIDANLEPKKEPVSDVDRASQ